MGLMAFKYLSFSLDFKPAYTNGFPSLIVSVVGAELPLQAIIIKGITGTIINLNI
jgi:hypothetical protein